MARLTMTYGTLPSGEQFDAAWDSAIPTIGAGKFHFGNDPRIGTSALTQDELWAELQRAKADYDLPEDGPDLASSCFISDTGDWISGVLGCLGIEWV